MKTPLSLIMLHLLIAIALVTGCRKEDKKIEDPVKEEPVPTHVTDIEGNEYRVVKIGNQIWMAENLRTKYWRDGTPIPTTDPPEKDIASDGYPAYQWPQLFDESMAQEWGRVYTYLAATSLRGVCPIGWRLPSYEDYEELADYVKENYEGTGGVPAYSHTLLSSDPNHWEVNPGQLTPCNTHGLSLQGGGVRINTADDQSFFGGFMRSGAFMTTKSEGPNTPRAFAISNFSPVLPGPWGGPVVNAAVHIRCIKE